jgi:hypothetical protein
MKILTRDTMYHVTGGQSTYLSMVELCCTSISEDSSEAEAERQAYAEEAMRNLDQSYDHVNLDRWRGYAK